MGLRFGGGAAEGRAEMSNLLGGKGANLAEMCSLGLPVPPGFTITTEVCTHYYDNGKSYPAELSDRSPAALAAVEQAIGARFGDADNPLLVSVRSGARASMPGMMDTVLNLGLNDATVEGLAQAERRRALRLGQLSPLHPDVRRRRARHRASPFRGDPRRPQARHRASRSTPTDGRRLARSSSTGTRTSSQQRDRQAVPAGRRRTSSGARSARCSARG